MDTLWNGMVEGLKLLFSADPGLWQIVWTSAQVSGIAVLVSMLAGVPLGALLGLSRFPGKRLVQAVVYTGMGLPPVVVGLAVYLLLSRSGILGPLNLPWVPELFTIPAMIWAQVIIATPLIVGVTMSSVADVSPDLRLQLRALGATRRQVILAILGEARLGVVVALAGGLGSVISEVGAVMMVGGNIEGSTRVLTTAIMLETRQGNFSMAISLAIVLILLAFIINYGVTRLQGRGR
jgi:tungstate transport system permease protein